MEVFIIDIVTLAFLTIKYKIKLILLSSCKVVKVVLSIIVVNAFCFMIHPKTIRILQVDKNCYINDLHGRITFIKKLSNNKKVFYLEF